ncbi:MAG: hypothetical protein WC455_21435 [Dehalococcoidia bacterium]|jgi:hypothetical protein
MANIEDLKQSITSMSNADLIALMKQTRESRRTSKREPSKLAKAKSATTKPATAVSVDQLLASMTPEAALQLLQQLEKQGGK